MPLVVTRNSMTEAPSENIHLPRMIGDNRNKKNPEKEIEKNISIEKTNHAAARKNNNKPIQSGMPHRKRHFYNAYGLLFPPAEARR